MPKRGIFLCLLLGSWCGATSLEAQDTLESSNSLQSCEWCGSQDAPDSLSWRVVISPEDEPGEKLIVSGTVFQPDGRTPAEGITVYVYHTNSHGVYPKRGNEAGNGRRHGYLRGWMKTNKDGKYEFETIKPHAYPDQVQNPAHIHYTIDGPDFEEYWIHSVLFKGDPLLQEEDDIDTSRTGGTPRIIELTKDKDGVLRGVKDIILRKPNES